MKTDYISTYAFNANLRSHTLRAQSELAVAQKEAVTGRVADVGHHLGARTAMAVNLDGEMSRLAQLTATNGVLEARMSVMQSAMSSLNGATDQLISQLTAEMGGALDRQTTGNIGQSLLETMAEVLNTNIGGEYVFSGVNTDALAFVEPGSTDGAAAAQAVRDAFTAHFGFTVNDVAAQSITGAQIEAFIDGPFADLFNDANWAALWSDASDRGMRARISPRELVENPVTAHAQGFRDLAAASVLVSEIGAGNLGEEAMDALAEKGLKLAATGIDRMSDDQSNLGVVEARVKQANDRMVLQKDLLARESQALTGVDPYAAATRLNELMVGLEASYTVTARLQALSLMNYI